MLRWALIFVFPTAVGSTEAFPRPMALPIIAPIVARIPLRVDDFARFTEQFEGRRARVYCDSRGRRTVGAGHNLDRPGSAVAVKHAGLSWGRLVRGDVLSDAQINRLLMADVSFALNSARDLVAGFDSLPDRAQLVVVDMIYNLGRTGFYGFENFRRAVMLRNWSHAAVALRDSDWYHQVPARSKVLVSEIRALHASNH